ncbi:MAG: penicillin-insensitive murein endopeptidase [Hyphomicrobiaceae bacterium]
MVSKALTCLSGLAAASTLVMVLPPLAHASTGVNGIRQASYSPVVLTVETDEHAAVGNRIAAFGAGLGAVWPAPPRPEIEPADAYVPSADDAIGQLIEIKLKKYAATVNRPAKKSPRLDFDGRMRLTAPRGAERPTRWPVARKAYSDTAVRAESRAIRLAAAEADRMAHAEATAASAAGLPPLPVRKPKSALPAKLLFGGARSAAPLAPRAIGFYSRGCLAGAQAMPIDGPAWQVMRLSRNRNWGHPKLIGFLEALAKEAKAEDNWPGLLVGDISQARGGPMLTGHSSHQVGLDADIWFTPMPGRRLSEKERETLSATSMISGPTSINREVFTDEHLLLVKRAASHADVERILVHPAIKKAMCEASGTDRKWLEKVRPIHGHHYHFHIRMACPKESPNCRGQAPVKTGDDGCGKELDDWFALLTRPPAPPPPGYKPPPPKPPITLDDLPPECRVVLNAGTGSAEGREADLINASIEAARGMIDISGEQRPVDVAPAATSDAAAGAGAD